jgi:DNA-binding protein HU-beta
LGGKAKSHAPNHDHQDRYGVVIFYAAPDIPRTTRILFGWQSGNHLFSGKEHLINKQDLVASVVETTGLDGNTSAHVTEVMLRKIAEALSDGEEVRLVNFGTFLVMRRKASTGRDPRTGAPIEVASVAQPKFRPSRTLKKMVS